MEFSSSPPRATNSRVYLDHAGAALPSPELMSAVANFLTSGDHLANPHSRHLSSQSTHAIMETARMKLLDYLNVDTDGERDYAVIFTSGTTASLKLLAETFDFGRPISGSRSSEFTDDASKLNEDGISTLMMLRDSHTSVMGMRNIARCERVLVISSYEELELCLERRKSSQLSPAAAGGDGKRNLFVLTAMSNFCGRKYPLRVVRRVREVLGPHWSVCLDAAALLGCSRLDLSRRAGIQPEFIAMSIYKIFGYPTGLGVLLLKRSSGDLLRKEYFGGGTVDFASDTSMLVRYREDLERRFEDGTPDFYSIAALRLAFTHGEQSMVGQDSFALAYQAYKFLASLKHANGKSAARVYGDGWKKSTTGSVQLAQGPIVTFNLLRDDGTWVGYSEVERMSDLFSIELRTGCFCNQGACSKYLELSEGALQRNLESGKVCGDEVSLDSSGHPIGAVRISFGRGSTEADLETFKKMITCCFTAGDGNRYVSDLSGALPTSTLTPSISSAMLSHIFIYPIKSCGAMQPTEWPLTASGFAYDRRWMLTTHHGGVPLTQKRFPALCSIVPEVDLTLDRLTLRVRHGSSGESPTQSLELCISEMEESGKAFYHSAIPFCNSSGGVADDVGGPRFSEWVSTLHPSLPEALRLVMMSPTSTLGGDAKTCKGNFANVAQYLLVTTTSIKCLAKVLGLEWKEVMRRFRPNLVIEARELVPFDEDNFTEIWICGICFDVVGKCARCEMVCIDQDTGEKDPNLLIALRDLRREAAGKDAFKTSLTRFGVYLKQRGFKIHLADTTAELRVGSIVRIIRGRKCSQL